MRRRGSAHGRNEQPRETPTTGRCAHSRRRPYDVDTQRSTDTGGDMGSGREQQRQPISKHRGRGLGAGADFFVLSRILCFRGARDVFLGPGGGSRAVPPPHGERAGSGLHNVPCGDRDSAVSIRKRRWRHLAPSTGRTSHRCIPPRSSLASVIVQENVLSTYLRHYPANRGGGGWKRGRLVTPGWLRSTCCATRWETELT